MYDAKLPVKRKVPKIVGPVRAFAVVLSLLPLAGCGTTSIFNAAFVNTLSGGSVPLTPGPAADFVLIRVVNETGQNAEFIVTVERTVIARDDEGNPVVEVSGVVSTEDVRETLFLNTDADAPGNELGVLFPCSESPINLVGLGENLLPGDIAVYIGGGGAAGAQGFGIPAGTLNPLNRLPPGGGPSNFNCGDTVIFRAIRSTGVTGGVKLQSFLLPGFEQPSIFSGPSTFENYEDFLESQVREEEP